MKFIKKKKIQFPDIIQEGIFRRTGSVARQNELRRLLNEQVDLDFSNGVYNVHDCASVLKAIIGMFLLFFFLIFGNHQNNFN